MEIFVEILRRVGIKIL